MAKSRETYNKKEKEKKKLKKRQDKEEKKEARKASSQKGQSLEDMLAYVDENGNISSTPPDPNKKKSFTRESISIGIPKQSEQEAESVRTGIVSFFNEEKGFGFIKDSSSKESIFVHIKALAEPVKENDKVTFDVEKTPKGLSAVDVKKIK